MEDPAAQSEEVFLSDNCSYMRVLVKMFSAAYFFYHHTFLITLTVCFHQTHVSLYKRFT